MITDDGVTQRMRRFMELRNERDFDKKKAESSEKAYRSMEAEIWDMLDASDQLPPFKFDLGEPFGVIRFSNRETHYGRILDEDAAIEGFEQRAVIEEMTKPKVVMQRVNEEVRDCLEQGRQLPPGIDFVTRRFVSITKEK